LKPGGETVNLLCPDLPVHAVAYKIPVSVLVVVHTATGLVLLIERADRAGWWQSVTGSQEPGESLIETARRELYEETGLDAHRLPLSDWGVQTEYEIFDCYRHRYPPGTTHNVEHVFGCCLPGPVAVHLSPREHTAQCWLPVAEAAAKCFSPSNAAAIRQLGTRSA
jgi:dATP pyrophosphohydrolase